MTTIRKIGPQDWEAFRDIRRESLADSPAAFGSTLEEAQARTDPQWESMVRTRTSSAGSAIWLAESTGGGAEAVVAADPTVAGNSTELVSMWVSPVARGSGLAAQLIDIVVAWAQECGSASVSLWVMRGNDRARRLYRSNGFVEVTDHHASADDPCRLEIRMVRAV